MSDVGTRRLVRYIAFDSRARSRLSPAMYTSMPRKALMGVLMVVAAALASAIHGVEGVDIGADGSVPPVSPTWKIGSSQELNVEVFVF